jgi:hypothetical protein
MTPVRWTRLLALVGALRSAAGARRCPRARPISRRVVRFDARDRVVACPRPADTCASPSALRELGDRAIAASTPDAPRHYALLLDRGPDALLARVNLIRAARRSIDLQTYIFDEDDAGHLVLDELMAAARRGVRVRVLVDQLSALKKASTLASLSSRMRTSTCACTTRCSTTRA